MTYVHALLQIDFKQPFPCQWWLITVLLTKHWQIFTTLYFPWFNVKVCPCVSIYKWLYLYSTTQNYKISQKQDIYKIFTVVVSFLHLSVPPKMLKELVFAWHWLMSTTRRSMSSPLVPLRQDETSDLPPTSGALLTYN